MKSGGRRALRTLLVFACLLGFAGLARAEAARPGSTPDAETAKEGGHEAGHGALYKWINFVLLVGGLGYVLRKPASEFFLQRSAGIRKSLEEGRKALESSQAQLRAVEEKLRHFEEAMAAFRAGALREMAEEQARIRQTTAAETARMMESVRTQMEVASKQARLELRILTAQMAVELAEKMIVQRLDEAGQRRLVSQFAARLETPRAPN
jgi:F0F1-type ATP synthase membrane subunit b/b'